MMTGPAGEYLRHLQRDPTGCWLDRQKRTWFRQSGFLFILAICAFFKTNNWSERGGDQHGFSGGLWWTNGTGGILGKQGCHCWDDPAFGKVTNVFQVGFIELFFEAWSYFANQGPCQPGYPGELHCAWTLRHPTLAVITRKGVPSLTLITLSNSLYQGSCLPCQNCAQSKPPGKPWRIRTTCGEHCTQ